MRLAYFFGASAENHLGHYLVRPHLLLTSIQHKLDRSHMRVLYRGSQHDVEEVLGPKHRETDMEPDHLSRGFVREALGCAKKVTWSDQERLDRPQPLLNVASSDRRRFDSFRQVFVGPLAPQVSHEEEGEQDEGDGKEDVGLYHMEQVQHYGDDRGDYAGNGVPVESQQA